jgi:hypothetical protein
MGVPPLTDFIQIANKPSAEMDIQQLHAATHPEYGYMLLDGKRYESPLGFVTGNRCVIDVEVFFIRQRAYVVTAREKETAHIEPFEEYPQIGQCIRN